MAAACANRTPTRNTGIAQREFLGARRHRKSSATGRATARPMHNAKNCSDVRGNEGSPVALLGLRGDPTEPCVFPTFSDASGLTNHPRVSRDGCLIIEE